MRARWATLKGFRAPRAVLSDGGDGGPLRWPRGDRHRRRVRHRRRDGAVVNVASISGLGGDRGLAAYNAAKAGMINLTRTAALELAPAGIRVNAVCPGLIATPALARALGGAPEREERARAAVPVGRF